MNGPTLGRVTTRVPAGLSRLVAGALFGFLLASRAWSVEVDYLEVATTKSAYSIDMSLRISAAATNIIAVLTDFSYPDPVNPDVTREEIVDVFGDVTRVRTEFEGCVLFVCREVELLQDVRVEGDEIYADIVPGGQSFRSGRLHWRILDDGEGGSRIEFRASMVHNFYVMPLIGEYLLRKRIRAALLESAENLETAASR